LEFYCLEEAIEPNNEVRLIDLFAASLNLADYGFKTEFMENGRPAYHPSDSFSPHTIYDAFSIS
jgi:transposase